MYWQIVLLGTATGPILHLSLFKRGEWHLHAPLILACWLVVMGIVGTGTVLCLWQSQVGPAVAACPTLLLCFLGLNLSTTFSIAVYRTHFHSLHRFPGPVMAKLTKFWHLLQCLRRPQYLVMDDLFHTYGPFVRTGPRELLVVHPDIQWRAANAKNACDKTDWYDLMRPSLAIIATRDRRIHDVRRRLWENALDSKNRREYVQRIEAYVDRLDEVIHEKVLSKQPICANDVFSWFAFDVMGLFAFGKSFEMLEKRDYHSATHQLHRGLRVLGLFSCMPWLARVGLAFIPGLWVVKDWLQLKQFCSERMRERVEIMDSVDIASHLIKAARESGFTDEEWRWLSGDGLTLIVGGSDTTATTLIFLFYELASHPEIAESLYDELEEVDTNHLDDLRRLPLLNGVISETLRLHPTIPSAGYRETPSEGLTVGDTFIPGKTKMIIPRWSIARLETCFENPDKFAPHRWSSKADVARARSAYAPFGFGRWSCVGKKLAMDELMLVTARLVQKYHVGLVPGRESRSVERDTQDHFVAIPGRLDLVFRLREDPGTL